MDSKQSSEKRFALLIDADNVSAKYIKPITDELSKYGTVTYKRIYGDWTLTLHAKWKDALLENSITPIQQFGYTQGKNATDSAMIIDAMDILYTRSVEGFCIVSSDSDFTRLASRIRESGLTVIGMGEKKTPVPFRKACDIFTTLELLLGDQPSKQSNRTKNRHEQGASAGNQNAVASAMSKEELEQAVVNIITDNLNNGKSTGLGEVGSRLLKRYPDFDVRSYGTNQLKKLLDEFAGIRITKDGSSVTVELAEDKDAGREPVADHAGEQAEEPTVEEAVAVEEEPAREKPRRRKGSGGKGRAAEAPVAPTREDAGEAAAPSADAEVPAAAPEPAESTEAATASEKKPRRSTRVSSAKNAKKPQPAQVVETASEPAAVPETVVESASEPAAEPALAGEPEAAPAADNRPGRARRKATASRASAKEQPAPKPAAKRAKPAAKPASKPASAPQPASAPKPAKPASQPADASTPEALVRQLAAEAGPEGVALALLGKRVRAKFRTFKLRDLGYSQFKSYVADLDGVVVEQRDGEPRVVSAS